MVLGEDRDEYLVYRREMMRDLRPRTPAERVQAGRVALLSWRLERAGWIEAGFLNRDLARAHHMATRELPRGQRQRKDEAPHSILVGMVLGEEMSGPSNSYETLRRYERSLERAFLAASRELERLRRQRLAEERAEMKGMNPPSPRLRRASADAEEERREEATTAENRKAQSGAQDSISKAEGACEDEDSLPINDIGIQSPLPQSLLMQPPSLHESHASHGSPASAASHEAPGPSDSQPLPDLCAWSLSGVALAKPDSDAVSGRPTADFYRTKPMAEWDVPRWNSFAQETLRPRLRAESGWDDGGEEAGAAEGPDAAASESGEVPDDDPAVEILNEYLYHKLKGEGDPAAAGTFEEFVKTGKNEWRERQPGPRLEDVLKVVDSAAELRRILRGEEEVAAEDALRPAEDIAIFGQNVG